MTLFVANSVVDYGARLLATPPVKPIRTPRQTDWFLAGINHPDAEKLQPTTFLTQCVEGVKSHHGEIICQDLAHIFEIWRWVIPFPFRQIISLRREIRFSMCEPGPVWQIRDDRGILQRPVISLVHYA